MDQLLVLKNCYAVDERGPSHSPVNVHIRNDRIVEITPIAESVDTVDALVLDTRGGTVVPGFVNMHEHLCAAHPGSLEEQAIAEDDEARWLLRMVGNAQKALRAGVTSMRLVGEKAGLEFKVRDAIARGLVDGPRIWTAGVAIDFKGGHASNIGAFEGDSPLELDQFATGQLGAGVDLLKLMISDSGTGSDLDQVKMSIEGFLAIRSIAREADIRMAIHTAAVDHPIMDRVIADGVDSLEHCYRLPDTLLRQCVAQQLLLVMTPLVSQSPEYYEAIQLPREMIENMKITGEHHWSAICRAVKSGARLALGTDFHSHLEFDGTWAVVRELELYEKAGAPPQALLSLASRNGAAWLGMQDELGLVEEGFLADLLILERSPLVHGASAFRSMSRVIAGGNVFQARSPEPPLRAWQQATL